MKFFIYDIIVIRITSFIVRSCSSLKKIILIIFILLLTTTHNYALFTLEEPISITASDINASIDTLFNKYPEYLEIKTIGYSVNRQPIKVLKVSNDIKSTNLKTRYNPAKKHSLVLAGLHAKEVITPVVFLEILEKNLEALKIGDKKTEKVFNENIIHFIPLMNPDGFDLAKYGEVHEIFGRDFNKYLKANTNGIDLNNNFPDRFYDLSLEKWHSMEEKAYLPSNFISYEPSVAYYWGTEIQPETEAVVNYMNQYYFEYFIDLHSQGDYMYWDHWHLSDLYRKENFRFAKKIQQISTADTYNREYTLGERSIEEAPHGFGYSTAYFASLYDNPAITLEVAKLSYLPYAKSEHYLEAISRLEDIFIELNGYKNKHYPFRVYKDQIFFSDYSHESYAEAVTKDIGGIYIYDQNTIKIFSGQAINPDLFHNLTYVFNKKIASIIIETIKIIKSTSY